MCLVPFILSTPLLTRPRSRSTLTHVAYAAWRAPARAHAGRELCRQGLRPVPTRHGAEREDCCPPIALHSAQARHAGVAPIQAEPDEVLTFLAPFHATPAEGPPGGLSGWYSDEADEQGEPQRGAGAPAGLLRVQGARAVCGEQEVSAPLRSVVAVAHLPAHRANDDTINAQYEIDVAHNNGVAHPFDEVVRDKACRKRLRGADCECCREVRLPSLPAAHHRPHTTRSQYYKAVGKLPPGPQPPLWRSPHATPMKATSPGRRHLADASSVPNSPRKRRVRDEDGDEDADEDTAAIAAHVQQISRHRQQWERPKTPPGYWEIAFPDTQEAAAINAQAREMHKQKRARVEEEAR